MHLFDLAVPLQLTKALFPDLQRPMLSFELTRLPSGDMYVQVVSGLA